MPNQNVTGNIMFTVCLSLGNPLHLGATCIKFLKEFDLMEEKEAIYYCMILHKLSLAVRM